MMTDQSRNKISQMRAKVLEKVDSESNGSAAKKPNLARTATADRASLDNRLSAQRFSGRQRKVKLPSGVTVTLTTKVISGRTEIERLTDVAPENIRDQSELTETRLAQLIEDFRQGFQLQPCLAWNNGEKDLFLDGSTRRMAAIFADSDLIYEVSDTELTPNDAVWIVDRSDKHDKLSDYEWGRYYLSKLNDKTQKELALELKVSEARLSRCINLFKTPDEVKVIMPSMINITAHQALSLNKLVSDAQKANLDLTALCEVVEREAQNLINEDKQTLENADLLNVLEGAIKAAIKQNTQSKSKAGSSKPEDEVLFSGKSSLTIKFKTNSRSKQTIVISRAPREAQDKIKRAIQLIMNGELDIPLEE